MPVTLPYFIPMPLSIFGTMGAFIRLKAPPTNRRVLLAIAAAGPLAGLAVALPLLVVGLRLSPLGPLALPGEGAVLEGNSLLYAGLKYLIFGRFLPGTGLDVHLHPIAFAAWAGLFVTGLNLIPAGQLDGRPCHLCAHRHPRPLLTMAITMALLGLGFFVWPGWYLWAGLVFVFGQTCHPARRHHLPDARGVALALLMLVVFALIFTPIPLMEL